MKITRHNKLVRDRIPEVIRRSGRQAVTQPIPSQEMGAALDEKLLEEVREYLDSHSVEEMADVLEVLHGIASCRGIPWDVVEAERLRKREERGGFEQGVRLVEVRSE